LLIVKMGKATDIFDFIRLREAQAAASLQRALIIQPGALGDCILTLPLAEFMKSALNLVRIDLLSNTEYTGILPGRTCIDSVRALNSVELHRLFMKANEFELEDRDPLIRAFADYEWIISFLGEVGSQFERNLIFTANCSHGVEVIILQLKAPANFTSHISNFYIQQLLEQNVLFEFQEPKTDASEALKTVCDRALISAWKVDKNYGRALLKEIGLQAAKKLLLIHPGSGSTDKCWHIENFRNVAKMLKSEDFEVLFVLGPSEMEKFTQNNINALEETGPCVSGLSLSEVLGLMSCINYFLGNDSGITHLSAAMGLKTVCVFGPTDPLLYRPIGPTVKVVQLKEGDFSRSGPGSQRQLVRIITKI